MNLNIIQILRALLKDPEVGDPGGGDQEACAAARQLPSLLPRQQRLTIHSALHIRYINFQTYRDQNINCSRWGYQPSRITTCLGENDASKYKHMDIFRYDS